MTVFTDGSVAHEKQTSGWAALVKGRKQAIHSHLHEGKMSPQKAEVLAIIGVLEHLMPDEPLHICTDSEYAFHLTTGKTKAYPDLYERIQHLIAGRDVHFHLVKGKSTKNTKLVDGLARMAAGLKPRWESARDVFNHLANKGQLLQVAFA